MRPWRRLSDLLRPAAADAELDEEIRDHLQRRTDELVARGVLPEEARAQARREFGGVEQTKEECRDERGWRWLSTTVADLRYGCRQLRRCSGFTLVAAGSLAVGIGGTTAIFSLADAALLRPLPVAQPERLVELLAARPDGGWQTNLPAPLFRELRPPRALVDFFASTGGGSWARLAPGRSERVEALFVSGNYFEVLGRGAALGRVLQEADDRAGAPPVAVLSDAFWRARLAARRDVLGGRLELDGAAVTIVGVAPAGFSGVDPSVAPAVFLPLAAERPTSSLWVAGRLRPGVSQEAATTWLAPLFARGIAAMVDTADARSWPARDRQQLRGWRPRLVAARNGTLRLRFQMGPPLRVLAGAVLLVLAIACTNVAALQLSRGERRSSEIAIRVSLGAGRGRVIRQLLTEGILLAGIGSALGLAVAVAFHGLLVSLSPLQPSVAPDFRLNARVLGFTVIVSAAAGVLTALLPALRLSRVDAYAVLKTDGTAARWRSFPRLAILATQVAASLVVLAGACVLLHSLLVLRGVDTGFDRRNVLLAGVHPGASRFRDSPPASWMPLLQEALRPLPGVRSVALAANRVHTGRSPSWILDVWVEGRTYRADEKQSVGFNEVGPGFFSTLDIPVLNGREFVPADRPGAAAVAIVNHAFARRYFGGASPVGRRFGTRADAPGRYEIVGVVADSKVESLLETPWPTVYLPLLQWARTGPVVAHLRTQASGAWLAAAIRRQVARVDPDLEIRFLDTLEATIDRTFARERMVAKVLWLFGALTLALTAVGLYGTMSYAAARRRAEIGVRTALGASERRILGLMLEDACRVIVAGAAVGTPLAALALHALRALVFGISPVDPVSLVGASLAVAFVGLTAAALPALTAARVAPAEALRQE